MTDKQFSILEIRDAIAETMKKCGCSLNHSQETILAGALGIWLEKYAEYKTTAPTPPKTIAVPMPINTINIDVAEYERLKKDAYPLYLVDAIEAAIQHGWLNRQELRSKIRKAIDKARSEL